ncbi:hypothetical protein K4K48_002966 [Colletotrichum sp. SAR 10_66]|nr:hypothetical protein K4K48_002966 [Colletotrichum sp. SAR 10_66]
MSAAVAYVHGQGIVHNDIKPANILFKPSRGAVLIDFGLSSELKDSAVHVGGSPWYIPPEIIFALMPSHSLFDVSEAFAVFLAPPLNGQRFARHLESPQEMLKDHTNRQLPIEEFTRSKKEKRRGIPFCVDTKAAILSGPVRLHNPTAFLEQPHHMPDVFSRLLRDRDLDHSPAFVHPMYKRFKDPIPAMFQMAVRRVSLLTGAEPMRGEGTASSARTAHHRLTASLSSDLPAGLVRLLEGLDIEDLDPPDTHAAAPNHLVLVQILASTDEVQSRYVSHPPLLSDQESGAAYQRIVRAARLAPVSASIGRPLKHRSPQHRRPLVTPDTSFVHGLHIDVLRNSPRAESDTRDAEPQPQQPQGPVLSCQWPDVHQEFGQWGELSEPSASLMSIFPAPSCSDQAFPTASPAFDQHRRPSAASTQTPRMHPLVD